MKITGVITEYNPFHNGHEYQLGKIREQGADYIVAVMSGDFTQRGEAAIVDKYDRTRMALMAGVDLVIELPVLYACSDAKRFAKGGVSILNSLGCIDEIAFGIEEGSANFVSEVAGLLACPPADYSETFDRLVRSGLSYPEARARALSAHFDETDLQYINGSNAILAIEYLMTLSQLDSSIKPLMIERKGSLYNDSSLEAAGFSSATAIRDALSNGKNLDLLSSHMPSTSLEILKSAHILFPDDFSPLLHYKLITEDSYEAYTDVTEAFSNRLADKRNDYESLSLFIDTVKSKNITRTSVSRLLCHILLDMRINEPATVPYARILGFKKNSSELLSAIGKSSNIPLISKLADADMNDCLAMDIKASDIYESAVCHKYGIKQKNEYTRGIVII